MREFSTVETEAVTEALGYEADNERIVSALNETEGQTLAEMEKELSKLVRRFEKSGGRGIELADEIDDLRIAIAIASLESK